MTNKFEDNFRNQIEKLSKIENLIQKENVQLSQKLKEEKNKLLTKDDIIKSLVLEIEKLDEENFSHCTQIKLEELKSKTCSDETIKSFENLLNDITLEIEFYKEKNIAYKEDTNIEISFLREKSIIKIKFLQNGQEVEFNLSDPNNVKCLYSECSNESIEDGKKQIMNNLISEFNAASRQNKNTSELVLMLRDLFDE
ncbi:unnamed protein product [Brachionus calyciflorus]|uniref:Uncharacterized protein n=1 Tax=Brachionus calyciflorus TaxID=104777 RepID=A0A814B4X5_9BILA|nr:unnamed protein product [Brachionus calyciflorus]